MKNKSSLLQFCLRILLLIVSCLHAFLATASATNKSSAATPPTVVNTTICNNQLPYSWNGITCLVAGTYNATLTGSNGADSIVVLNLSVINVGTSITNAIICDNALPYHWNGNVYLTSGTYSVTLTSSSGCDSVPILSLTVNHVVTSTTNRTICSNELPFSWNGNNYPAAGTYAVTLSSAAGCDSIATLNLSVNQVSSGTTNATVCINELPYNWNGNSYPVAGNYTVVLPASNGCDSTVTLNLSTTTTTTSTTLVSVCNNQLPYNWNGQNYSAAGNYSINLTGASGCDSVATLSLSVKPVLISNWSATICTAQLPYVWNGNNYNAAGNYQVTLTSSTGCDSIAKLYLFVFDFYSSTTTQAICDSELPYTWNGNSYTASGVYTASFVTAAGCDSVATLNLDVVGAHVASDSLIICENELPYNYHGHIITAAGDYSIVPPFAMSPCRSIDSINVEILPVITSTTSITICNNQLPYTWNGTAYNAAGTYIANLTSTAGCDSTASLNLSVNTTVTSSTNLAICSNQVPYSWNGNLYSSSGIYTATLTSSGGCDSIATVNLIINSSTDTTINLVICNSQTPYSWNGNNYSTSGNYLATLTSSGGCDSIVRLNLEVQSFLTSTTNINICDNLLPYSWNGNSYAGAGSYNVNLVSSAGCDSVATLNLVVNPVITSTTNIDVCISQLPYNWNGNIYPAGGTYTVTLITSGGCDSVATLNLIEHSPLTSTTGMTICNNQLPFSWNGNSYSQAGVFPVTLSSSGGCDSIAILDLTVTDILTSTTNVNVCPGQLPYLWNGNNYPTGGTYSVTLHNSNGCDSVPILSLTVVPYVTSETEMTICDNELPYTWNGNVFTTAGTYSVLLPGTACDSLAALNLTVIPPITSITDASICTQQFPYTWNGNSYPAAGTYQVTLTSSSGCDSVATLNLLETTASASVTDFTACVNQLPYVWNGNSYPSAGTFSITLTGSSGCDSVATLNLTTNLIDTSTTSINLCTNQLPYIWNGNSYSTGGTYYVPLNGNDGCDSVATLILSATPVVTSITNVNICDNSLPYSWNGNDYTVGGSYSVTFTSSSGCDSIATLELVVNAVVTSNTNAALCDNNLPYSWNGNDYTVGGSYSITFTSSGGCDSIATLNLTINAVDTSNTNINMCDSGLPYSWNGQSYSSAGVYSTTLTSAGGCDSVAILNLTISTADTSTTNINICTNQLPYIWNGSSYTTGGTYYVPLNGNDGCDSVATLILSASSVVTSITNVSICDNNLPYSWNGNDYTTGGSYSMSFTGSSGCDSIETLNLVVSSIVTSNTNAAICDNNLPYTWNGNDYTVGGSYSVTFTSSGGCDSIATLNLTINTVDTSNTNINMCDSGLPYLWNGQSYSSTGVHSITLTSAAGCDSIAILNLTISTADTSITNINICTNQLPYIWNGNSYTTGGTYYVPLNGNDGCDSVATLILSASSVVTSITNVSICDNNLPYSWNGNDYTTGGSYSMSFTGSSGCDSIATLNLVVSSVVTGTVNASICNNQLPYSWNGQSYTSAGTYSVTLTSAGGCDSIVTLILTVNSVVTSNTNVNACGNELPYSWNGQNYTSAGTYSITLTSTGGCDSIATLNLYINTIDTGITNINICNNQLPYTWNGNSYSTGGTYFISLNSNDGCDSVAMLVLSANPVVTSTTNVTTCDDNLPYSWNGNNYTTGGSYSISFTGSSGCDSVATLNLVVNAVLTSNTTTGICDNQLPYSWNGQNYTATGTYSVTLTSTTGCDSIATLNLSVNSFVSSNTNASTCDNELPYLWNGQSYTSAGTYSITLTSTSGCDSIATLNLIINSADTSNSNVNTCDNQLPYIWNGNSYSTAGIYYVSLNGTDGCDSVATLILSINPVVSSSTNVSICDNNLPYSWNGNDYTSSGSYSATFTSSSGCDSIATLNLMVNPVASSEITVSICNDQLPYSWNGQNYTSAGAHSITLTGTTGCDSIATLNLIINPVVTSTTNANTCDNELPYLWNGQSYTSAGTHSITLTSTAGCDSIATLQLAIHPVTSSNTNFSICSVDLPYTWNGQSYTASGNYTVTLTSSSGCDSMATLQLTVNPTPGPAAVTSPVIYCQFDVTAPLAATTTVAGGHLLWYSSATGGTGVTVAPIPSSAIAGTTNYYVSQVDGPCEGPRTLITVTINSKPALGPDKDLRICFGQSANLTSLYNVPGSNWTYNQQPVVNPAHITVEGSYQLIAINNTGCSDTVFVNLGIQPPIIANAGDDANIEANVPYQLSGSGGGQYQWSPSQLLSNPFTANPVVTLNDSATLVLMVMDEIGCFDLDTVKLRVLNGPTFYVPSAFTPNGDGVNDIFRPTAVGIAKLHFFRVFNRYGELVFETTEIGKGWDGIYRGIKQNTGNFVWSLKGTDRKGQEKIMKGNVVLIR